MAITATVWIKLKFKEGAQPSKRGAYLSAGYDEKPFYNLDSNFLDRLPQ